MVTEEALAANRWFIGLAREHRVFPPSATTDGFRQIVDNMKAGRTAMTIHHIGSANEMVQALGDRVTAVPVPRGPGGKGWTAFGDGSNAIFAQSRNAEAAWLWISFLSSEGNVEFNRLSGQLPVTTSGARAWDAQPRRFIEASMASLPLAATLPASPRTADFTRTVWPQTTQRALLGQIQPDEMMRIFERHFHG
jgi:multiple sugar transport system substrate-binding protein